MDTMVWAFFGVSLLLAVYEFAGVLRARLQNLTRSTGRVVMRGTVVATLVVLLWQHLGWRAYIAGLSASDLGHPRLFNVPYVLCNVSIGLIGILVARELVSLARAMRQGLTKNVSRFVTSVLILLCLLPILKETMGMWDQYTEALSRVASAPRFPPLAK